MATARFYVPTDSIGNALIDAFDSAELQSYSSTEIRLGVPGGATLLILYGQFNFGPDGMLNSGTLTGLTSFLADGVSKEMVLTGMNVDLLTLVDIAMTGSENDLINLFFGGADRFTGSSGADELPTYGGNDTIDGGAGNDTMEGGNGSDLYYVRDVGDRVVETNSSAASGGTDTVQSYLASYTLPTNVENGRIMISTAAKLSGNGLANVLTGGSGSDTLAGGAANDTLSGGSGNDLLDGGSGNDSMTGGAGNDRYVVQASGDKVIEQAGGGTDTIHTTISWTLPSEVEHLLLSGTNHSTLAGNGLANKITGNGGNNVLDGGGGADTLTGGAGNDTFQVNNSGDVVVESAGGGSDTIKTTISYKLPAEVEHLLLSGTNHSTLTGNGLANKITGNGGNNVLDGGGGRDTLTGAAGLDIFRFSSALNASTNVDTVADFNPADDAVQLENAIFIKLAKTGALPALNFAANTSGRAVDGNDFVVYETDTGKLFYDADGSGAGTAVQIALLAGAPVLSNLDFFVT